MSIFGGCVFFVFLQLSVIYICNMLDWRFYLKLQTRVLQDTRHTLQQLQVLRENESGKGRRSERESESVSANANVSVSVKGSLLLPLTSTYDQVSRGFDP